jgi:hypothetical protein
MLILLRSLLRVDSLIVLPAKLSRKWRLFLTVAAGLFLLSSSRSFSVASSAIGVFHHPSWGKRLSLTSQFCVALDRGEADAKHAGSLRFGCAALLECLYYLLA